MNETLTERLLDVRTLPPRQKHPALIATWNELPPGQALLLIDDHDPLPLYYQFSCEHAGGFHWEYLEHGPATWRVRISKGDFPEPGFVPEYKAPVRQASETGEQVNPLVLDARPFFARGTTPCEAIDNAVARLRPGQPLVLLVPFEPVPLYTKLGGKGFLHETTQLEDGTWRVEFRKGD
jgi:uncharacterized protein (DUF2249 family)